ncbi:MAG: hypothetical protein IPF65_13615 [Polaromonas sp.]|nr:hypothetical protein [Polaromonas sp.]
MKGRLEQGVCSTQGGAKYNIRHPGHRHGGRADPGAIESAVFEDKWLTLEELVAHLKDNLSDEVVRTRLKGIDKFGNDIPKADAWMKWVGDHYFDPIHALGKNTRGGQYLAGGTPILPIRILAV